jgi:2-amino-4-hydroxy-6-hydroxymethyldihydropteridine diphosphokinase
VPRAHIGVGANLGDAAANVRQAIALLARCGTVERVSSLYRTKAWGVTDQPDFVNAAVALRTDLEPRALLRELKALESELGREPTYRWGPRAVDLDILAYDDLVLDEPELQIPHPRLHERGFALIPLAEIDESYRPAASDLSEREKATVTLLD